jgi:hypothetical protein
LHKSHGTCKKKISNGKRIFNQCYTNKNREKPEVRRDQGYFSRNMCIAIKDCNNESALLFVPTVLLMRKTFE